MKCMCRAGLQIRLDFNYPRSAYAIETTKCRQGERNCASTLIKPAHSKRSKSRFRPAIVMQRLSVHHHGEIRELKHGMHAHENVVRVHDCRRDSEAKSRILENTG